VVATTIWESLRNHDSNNVMLAYKSTVSEFIPPLHRFQSSIGTPIARSSLAHAEIACAKFARQPREV
jgi:hypothetical protein